MEKLGRLLESNQGDRVREELSKVLPTIPV
jgi:hypothetical protein